MLIPLSSMTPPQAEGWRALLDLYEAFPADWRITGGQMVWLLAREHSVEPIRATEDTDVVIEIRADQGLMKRVCAWLEERAFDLEGISADSIGHRYVSTTYTGPGKVAFDILAPENVGDRADLTTSPPARTVPAPGTRDALDAAEPVEIILGSRSGHVPRPPLISAILAKAAATTIPGRANPERDWADLAFLLTLVPDPLSAAANLTRPQRRKLRAIGAPPRRGSPGLAATRVPGAPGHHRASVPHGGLRRGKWPPEASTDPGRHGGREQRLAAARPRQLLSVGQALSPAEHPLRGVSRTALLRAAAVG